MNELFKEAREHGAVPLNEATRASGDDKSKVMLNFKTKYAIYIFDVLYSFLYYVTFFFSSYIFLF